MTARRVAKGSADSDGTEKGRQALQGARYARLDPLCLDEIGYVHLDPRGAEILFEVITERDGRASVAVVSNLPFSEWGSVFPDGRLAAAVVDHLTYRAHVIETGSEPYRLPAGKARKGGPMKG